MRMNPVGNILRSVLRRPDDKLNVLTFLLDGQFDSFLARTGHNFISSTTSAKFPVDKHLINRPANLIISDEEQVQLSLGSDIDLIVINDRERHYQIGASWASMLHVPLLLIEHINPFQAYNTHDTDVIAKNFPVSKHIVTNQHGKAFWKHHVDFINVGVDVERYFPDEKDGTVLLVGQFQQQDFGLLQALSQQIPKLKIVGNNPGISSSNYSHDEILNMYRRASVYIHLATAPYVSIPLLQAMASGCTIVTNDTPITNEIIRDGEGFRCKSIQEIIQQAQRLPVEKFGEAARERVVVNFNQDNLLREWNMALTDTSSIIYVK